MSEQLSLTGFDTAAPTDQLYFAILPDADAAAHIEQRAQRLHDELGLRGKPLAPERFHITLHDLGEYAGLPQNIVTVACDAAAAVALPPFDIAFDRVVSFGGGSLVLRGSDGLAALIAFRQALGTAMTGAGLGRRVKRSFTPHVTLLYGARRVAEQAVDAIGWKAREFVLVHGKLGRMSAFCSPAGHCATDIRRLTAANSASNKYTRDPDAGRIARLRVV
jgi:RNA 2',3'-cyclic 3'-phosphodiesterase